MVDFRQLKWDQRYLRLARTVGEWSKDPSTKVGAILVRPNNSVAATGFNGFPPGEDDSPELYADREYKYKHVVHAEINAINFLRDGSLGIEQPARGFTLYTSFSVCPECMKRMGSEGIARVVFPPLPFRDKTADWLQDWSRRSADAMMLAGKLGIRVKVLSCE